MSRIVLKKNNKLDSELKKYIEEEMILEFEDFEEIKDYINFNCPEVDEKVESVDDLKRILGKYGFSYEGKYYDIQFDEALKVRDYLPRGFFEMPQKLKHTDTYDKFEAYVDGMLEGKNSNRARGEIINQYSNLIYKRDWVVKTTSIKSKNDFQCFKDKDYTDEERKDFVGDLADFLGKKINIDDPKTWLPFLKAKATYVEDIGFAIQDIDENFDDIISRLYEAIEEYNKLMGCANETIKYYKNSYNFYTLDSLYIAFSVGRVYQIGFGANNGYDQKRIYDMVIDLWKEFDGFNYDLEDEEGAEE